jgi:serine protease Do
VKEGSAAEAEGIKEGDLITKVVHNRRIQPLTSVKEFQDLASKSDELSFYVQSGKAQGRFVTLSKSKK